MSEFQVPGQPTCKPLSSKGPIIFYASRPHPLAIDVQPDLTPSNLPKSKLHDHQYNLQELIYMLFSVYLYIFVMHICMASYYYFWHDDKIYLQFETSGWWSITCKPQQTKREGEMGLAGQTRVIIHHIIINTAT